MLLINTMKPSLTVILLAYNEAQSIRSAYETAVRALRQAGILDYEILIITNSAPDGTHDGTPDIAVQIAKEDPSVRCFHYNNYAGLGFKYRKGIELSQKEYITWIPGDDDTVESSFINNLKHLGEVPAVITYTINTKARPFYIRFVSRCFVLLCNILFGLRMKYYNGFTIYSKELLREVPMTVDNPAFMAEIIIYLIKSGVKYIELSQEIKKSGAGKTFCLKSVLEVSGSLALLFWRINIRRERIKI